MTMDIINRSAVVLRPARPYLEWAKLDDTEGLAKPVFDGMRSEPAFYLVPGWEEPDEEREILKEFWPALFEAMLSAWAPDETLWSTKRTHEMFKSWFDIETHAMIEDIYEDEAIDYVE